jgi:rod shape-determining protein MreC
VKFEKPRRTLDYVIAVFLLIVPAAFLHANFKQPAKANGFDRVVLRISAPLQRGVSWVIGGISGLWGRYVWLVDVDEENAELRTQNEELRRKLSAASAENLELEDLRSLARVRERLQAETIGARVISVGLSPSFRTTRMVLDRGENEIAKGMPVVADKGVVGKIDRVYGRYADVRLAVDPLFQIPVTVETTGARGILKGSGGDNAYACKISFEVQTGEVHVDDRVVTAGFQGGILPAQDVVRVFPRGIEVGKVKSVSKPDGLYQEVELEPSVDFTRLDHVVVILSAPPPPDPTAKQKKLPEPAFGFTPK